MWPYLQGERNGLAVAESRIVQLDAQLKPIFGEPSDAQTMRPALLAGEDPVRR